MRAAALLLLVTLQLLLGGASAAATEYMRAAPCGADGSGARIGVLRNGTIAVATDCVGITRGVQWDQALATDVWPAWLHSVTVYTDAHNEHSSDFAQPGGTLLVEYRELSSKEASSNTRCPGEDTTATSGVCMADLQRLSHSTMHVNGTLEIVQKRAGGGMHFVQAVHVAELVATLLKSQSQLQSAADAEAETDDAGAGAAESTADAGFQEYDIAIGLVAAATHSVPSRTPAAPLQQPYTGIFGWDMATLATLAAGSHNDGDEATEQLLKAASTHLMTSMDGLGLEAGCHHAMHRDKSPVLVSNRREAWDRWLQGTRSHTSAVSASMTWRDPAWLRRQRVDMGDSVQVATSFKCHDQLHPLGFTTRATPSLLPPPQGLHLPLPTRTPPDTSVVKYTVKLPPGASKTRGVLGVVKHSGSLEADGSGHRTIGVVMHTVVNGTGLHRMVTRDVVLAAPPPEAGNLSSCSIVAAQRFQPALYADLDEIRSREAFGGPSLASFVPHIDIERSTAYSFSHLLFLDSPACTRDEVTSSTVRFLCRLQFPVHLRYQSPVDIYYNDTATATGDPDTDDPKFSQPTRVLTPQLLLRCATPARGRHCSATASSGGEAGTCRATDLVSWTELSILASSEAQEAPLRVPVGLLHHLAWVAAGTSGVTLVVALLLVVLAFKTPSA